MHDYQAPDRQSLLQRWQQPAPKPFIKTLTIGTGATFLILALWKLVAP